MDLKKENENEKLFGPDRRLLSLDGSDALIGYYMVPDLQPQISRIYRLASSNNLREKHKHLDCRYQVSFVSGVFGIVRTSSKTISTGQATSHSLIL